MRKMSVAQPAALTERREEQSRSRESRVSKAFPKSERGECLRSGKGGSGVSWGFCQEGVEEDKASREPSCCCGRCFSAPESLGLGRSFKQHCPLEIG